MRTSQQNIRFLSVKEVRQIIDNIPDDKRGRRDRALLEVLFSTGLRISEALALKVKDIGSSVKTQELTIIGKGGWQRVVYLSPLAVKAVFRYLASRMTDEELLFPITARTAQIMVKKRAKEAGVDKFVSPHIWRHSFGTFILGKTGNLRLCQELLGHRSIVSTQRYTHVTSSELKSVHNKLFKDDRYRP